MWRSIVFGGAVVAMCGLAAVWCAVAAETLPANPVAAAPVAPVTPKAAAKAEKPAPKAAVKAEKPAAKATQRPSTPAEKPEVKQAPAVAPKPLSKHVKAGTKWLIEHQLNQGAWGQGEESAEMGGGSQLKDVPSVADTCMAALALIRAGNTPTKGEYAKNLLHAVEFVCGEIEESDKDSLYITSNHSTRVQIKLGPYIDTFAAAVLLRRRDA